MTQPLSKYAGVLFVASAVFFGMAGFLYGAVVGSHSLAGQSVMVSSYAPDSWKLWQDGVYGNGGAKYSGYQLRYPRDFDVAQGDAAAGGMIGTTLVRISFPQDAFQKPKSNYGGAFLTVSSASDKDSIKNCFVAPSMTSGMVTLSKVVDVNGITYRVGDATDAGAGNLYTSKLYRVVHDNRCYEIALTVHTGNIANYTPSTVVEFDKQKAYDVLQQMLATFSFTEKNPNTP